MPKNSSDAQILRHNVLPNGTALSREERERLLKPYLPVPRTTNPAGHAKVHASTDRLQASDVDRAHTYSPFNFLRTVLHIFVYHIIQSLLALHIHVRLAYNTYREQVLSTLFKHHRTPELIHRDTHRLGKVPQHLSVIVDLEEDTSTALYNLIGDVAELISWCACCGIEHLTVYEQRGLLKIEMPHLVELATKSLSNYFPEKSIPTLNISAPNLSACSPASSKLSSLVSNGRASREISNENLTVLLLSSLDGRDALVDLTKTVAAMSQKGKVSRSDVTTDLIQAELQENCGKLEPDLLVVMARRSTWNCRTRKDFNGPAKETSSSTAQRQSLPQQVWGGDGVYLRGYPPWQARLTEIFHIENGFGISYSAFLQALHRFAAAEMRFGK